MWVRARWHGTAATWKKADAECRWFVRTYSQRSDMDADIKDPDELLLVAQAGAENARWHNLSDQFTFILTEVLNDALKNDKNFWRRGYCRLPLLEKYNRGEALDAFDKALKINPSAAEALVGKGRAPSSATSSRRPRISRTGLEVNAVSPRSPAVAVGHPPRGGKHCRALRELEAARQIFPTGRTYLGRIAACFALQGKPGAGGNRKGSGSVRLPSQPSSTSSWRNGWKSGVRYGEAEKHFQKAMELRPMLPGPATSLACCSCAWQGEGGR